LVVIVGTTVLLMLLISRPGASLSSSSEALVQVHLSGIAEVPDFLEQIVASGGHLWACRLSADMNHLTEKDLYADVEGIISDTDFIEFTDGAQLLFI
jgi:predicted peroxiredoxin